MVTRKNFEFDVFVSHKPDYFCSGIQSGNIKVVDRNLQTCLLLSCDHILEIFSKMKWFEEHSAGQKQSSSMKCFLAQWNYSFSYWKWVSKEKQQTVLSEECLLENYQNEVLSLLLYVIILLLLFSFTSPVSICGHSENIWEEPMTVSARSQTKCKVLWWICTTRLTSSTFSHKIWQCN